MKIRIEPTECQGNKVECQNPKIEVWLAGDDHNLQEVIDYLVTPALKAFGYGISEGQISVGEFDPEA
jgi:hypothetical protein